MWPNWTPSNWASLRPFGVGLQRPNNYLEIARAISENYGELGYAWRILNEGVCDGCALGTSGLKDWTLPGPHLCNIRLRLLRLNTMPAFDMELLRDAGALREKSSAELLELGRLPYPALRRAGETGFTRIGWDEAYLIMADKIRASEPRRVAFYLTSRGMPNESYYAAQKAVRAMGCNNIDNAARVCHSPSTNALKGSIGYAASTCSYADLLNTDLIVFVGSNVAKNQPVATKYLHYAKKNGAQIAVVNTYREPGMEQYWIPSVPESALFGTRLADRFFLIHTGGDIAFMTGALKHLVATGRVDSEFINAHTSGFEELSASVASQSWESLEAASGVPRAEMEAFADLAAKAKRAIFVWSMGVTQHACGEDNVRAIVNVALSRGFLGREGCGLMPIRGHSGVQGGAEMGAYAGVLPGGLPFTEENIARFTALWGFAPPREKGLTALDMIDRAQDGELDFLFSAGGNFLEVLPAPELVEAALRRVPLRVHMDIILSKQMLVDSAEATLLLPAATRYETPGGVTETSTERRVIFSPEIRGRRIGEAKPEWEVFLELAARLKPELADRLRCGGTPALREEIARAVPFYDGIQQLKRAGDQFQYGGTRLCEGGRCNTPDGKARFCDPAPHAHALKPDEFIVSTRRGKQFNSMVHENRDAITGAARDAVFMSADDAARLKLAAGDAIVLRANGNEYRGRVYLARLMPGNLQVHWPEGNTLIDPRRRSPEAGVPDYNAVVTIAKL